MFWRIWSFLFGKLRIQNTSDSPFFIPFIESSDFHEKTLQGSPSRVFWDVMSEVCPGDTEIHFNSRTYLTHQTNINFPLFSGLSVFLWMNSLIARRIKSEWLIWYLSHKVVISSLRTSGNLRQVWFGCFFISISFRHFGFWRPFDWRSLECVSS